MEEIKGTITAEATINGEVATERAIEGRLDIAGIGGGGNVDDVQINGTSIVVDKVANIPIADRDIYGLVKAYKLTGLGGVNLDANDRLVLTPLKNTDIDARKSSTAYNNKPVTNTNLDYAVKQAMCDGKGAEWTEEEKANARARMGVNQAYLVEEFTLEEDANTIDRSSEPDLTPYNFESLVVVIDCTGLTFNNFSVWLRLNHSKTGQWLYSGQGEFGSNNTKYGVFKWKKTINGFIESGFERSANASATGTQSATPISIPSNIVRLNTIINDFRLYTTGSGVIPSGTKISIYGVRA